MKFNWGWGIAVLYCSFAVLIGVLVVSSNRQKFDLVSNDYYGEEIAYQKIIEGGKNQASLSVPIAVQTNDAFVTIAFPPEFKDKGITGKVDFYCPINSEWDYSMKIGENGYSLNVDRKKLRNTKYTVKINCTVDGKNYYQESDITLL